MKKHLLITAAIALMAGTMLTSYKDGPGSKNVLANGAPGNMGNCGQSGCHGFSPTTTGNFASVVDNATGQPVSKYIRGHSYTIQVTGGSSTGKTHFGFQVAAIKNADNGQAGVFPPPTNSMLAAHQVTTADGNITVVEHTAPIPATAGAMVVSFNWTAPSDSTGPITLYGIVNGVNNDGSSSGDQAGAPFTKVLADGTNVEDVHYKIDVSISPNPAKDYINVKMEHASSGKYIVNAFDLSGRKIFETELTINTSSYQSKIDTHDWATGLYHIQIIKDGLKYVVPVLKG